jgi:hypothetical protein
MTQDGLTLQLSIEHSLEQTYAFLREPENFPKWASGLGSGLTRENDTWYAAAPQGKVEVTFSEANPYGVADHWVKPPDGPELYIPLRVIANGAGCEVLLTLFRSPGVSDDAFAHDQDWVRKDLRKLKQLLESGESATFQAVTAPQSPR